MTEPKFTPAPWRFSGSLKSSYVGKDGYGMIAEVPYCFHPNESLREAQKANANLIAAAPDLYDALSWIEGYTKDYPIEQYGDEFKSWVEKSRAALAKARGET